MIEITAVTICVNYADYLECSIRWNKRHFKRWIIVTTSGDVATQELCEREKIEYLVCDGFTDEHGPFQKSKGINHAFNQIDFLECGEDEYVLHMDADIILPQDFTDRINGDVDFFNWQGPLCDHRIYSCDRVLLNDSEMSDYKIENLFDIMDRYELKGSGGKFCSGYFQLFAKHAIRHNDLLDRKFIYPEFSRDASFDDGLFSKLFYEIRQINMTVIHLGDIEVNWKGRK